MYSTIPVWDGKPPFWKTSKWVWPFNYTSFLILTFGVISWVTLSKYSSISCMCYSG